MKRLGSAIDKLSQIPETELMLLPGNSPVIEKDLAAHTAMLASLEGLVDMVNPTDEVEKLRTLLDKDCIFSMLTPSLFSPVQSLW